MTNAEARFNNSLHPRKPEGSLGRTAQDVHLDSHTAPELCKKVKRERLRLYVYQCRYASVSHHQNEFCIKMGRDENLILTFH